MKTIATYLVAVMVLVLAFYAAKVAVSLVLGTMLRTAVLAVCGVLVLGVGANFMLRKR